MSESNLATALTQIEHERLVLRLRAEQRRQWLRAVMQRAMNAQLRYELAQAYKEKNK